MILRLPAPAHGLRLTRTLHGSASAHKFLPLETDIDLRRRIMLVPHHILHPRGIGVIEEGKGRGRVTETVDHNAGFLHTGKK